MYSLFKKEIKTFLGSLIGYLAILVFLLVTGLFLWVFPGVYNIPDNDYATLQGLFELAPWLYLFLIPAITMRFFADEKRSGTIEILLTRPVSDFKLVAAKFFAGLVLVGISLLPTLLYFLSVYLLGNPIGNIDTGATWGSFIGLFFLAAIYLAIGIFASSLTDNQIVSFILAMVLSFLFYLGFDFIATSGIPYILEQLLGWFSINNHYQSLARGVVDMRDVIYFVGITLIFLLATSATLRTRKWKKKKVRVNFTVTFILLMFIFWLSGNFLFRIDLTSDKRYSLSQVSTEIAADFENPVEIEFYLDGEMEPGLRKLRQEVLEKVAVLNAYSEQNMRIRIRDPYRISNQEDREAFIEELIEKGITPTSFRRQTEQGVSTRLIFPGAVIRAGGREIAVNFLKYNQDFTHEANFNHSIETVEFELVNAFQKLQRDERSTIAFLEGHGELDQFQVYDFAASLAGDFNIKRITADSLIDPETADILVVANPVEPFEERDKYLIDQFVMNGGKIIWMVEPVKVSLDSLTRGYMTLAFPRDVNLSDQLFRYGVRLNHVLLQDVECAQLQVNTAPAGSPPQLTLHPWYYSPLLVPNDSHPLSRNLNRVLGEFVSSVDLVEGNPNVEQSVILTTSPYARTVESPSTVSLENINNPPARELFDESFIPVGVLLEGSFSSVFQNRIVEPLGFSSSSVLEESVPTKMVVIADGGTIENEVDYSTSPPRIQELGFDRVSGQTFGNKEFMLNTFYYLNDDRGIMHLRSRTQQMRLLDRVRLREEKPMWQWLNVAVPPLFIAIFGLLYNAYRRRRFARS